jgi:hypothetical protein
MVWSSLEINPERRVFYSGAGDGAYAGVDAKMGW